MSIDEKLIDVVDEYLHWRKVNPHIKGGENYLKRLREAARATPEAGQPDELGTRALRFLEMQGYRRCDIAACNCPYWHGGKASERLDELHDLMSESGFQPHAKTIYKALEELIIEHQQLTATKRESFSLSEDERLEAANIIAEAIWPESEWDSDQQNANLAAVKALHALLKRFKINRIEVGGSHGDS